MPVLSRSLIGGRTTGELPRLPRSNGHPRRSVNGTGFVPRDSPRPAGGHNRFRREARPPRPSEPILIPKLRIQFADFPYLHYSIDQRLFTLETCCGYGYELVRVRRHLPGIFKVRLAARGCRENFGTLRLSQNPFSVRDDSRASAAYAEKTTLPRAPAGVSRSRRVATTDTRIRIGSATRFRNMDRIPFRLRCGLFQKFYLRKHRSFDQGFP